MRTIRGRYVLETLTATHGLESTWAALDQQSKRRVAVNLRPPGANLDPQVIAAVARIRSPYVESIYDHGVDETGEGFIVSELIQGEDLETRVQRRGPFTLPALIDLMSQVSEGVHALHTAGVLHLSLRPSRITLVRLGAGEVAKILYGGSLERFPAPQSPPLKGVPLYMSPEQVTGGVLDPRSDLWGLAAIAFHVLTGQPPFRGGDTTGPVFAAILYEDPTPASRLNPALGPAVDLVFARAFQKDPAARFQSAREMARAFSALGKR